MSKSSLGDFGLGLLWLPGGFIFIVVIVAALFGMAHDAPSMHLTSAHYHQAAEK